MSYCLAIDIGASSGRHILGSYTGGKLVCEEIYRFENGFVEQNGTFVWDTNELANNVIAGIAKCKELGKIPDTVAIDTWGVDYVLLDKDLKEIYPAVAYRDSRTDKSIPEVEKIISFEDLYKITGTQKLVYNTVYQLYCDKMTGKLENAEHFLMIPDYLNFRLTGVVKNEYTNASTTALLNAEQKNWDEGLLDMLGIKKSIFKTPELPGTVVGNFTEEIKNKVGFDSTVILSPSHDTASAVAACPVDDKSVYISSGTWSIVGTENLNAVTTPEALAANFSNEGGIDYRYRFLKNIMGMWLFQNIRRELDKKYTYDEMMEMAMASNYKKLIDPTDNAFLAPKSMLTAIRTYLGEPNLEIGDVLSSVYHSLATSYDKVVKEIESVSGKTVDRVSIVGGGCRDRYLNKLTREYTGKTVTAGPVEATATGNLMSQLIYLDKDLDLAKARQMIINSFDIKEV